MEGCVTENAATCPNCGFPFVSAEEAAQIIGVSYSRVRAILACHPERLRAFRVGRAWLIPESAVRAFHPLPPHRPRKTESKGE
jgi:excisionase family DNA binding protein